MNSVQQMNRQPDGSWRWSCEIDRDYHQQGAKAGFAGLLVLVLSVLGIGAAISLSGNDWSEMWYVLPVLAVILVIALPLLFLYRNAENPREQYELTETYVKSGYGKGAVYTEFARTETVILMPKYIEISDKNGTNRIYVPDGSMNFVIEFFRERLPEKTRVTDKRDWYPENISGNPD